MLLKMDNINDNAILTTVFAKKNKTVPSKDHNDKSKQPEVADKAPKQKGSQIIGFFGIIKDRGRNVSS
ncbi:unnamed protein product [Amaranthus hypochondriacus]